MSRFDKKVDRKGTYCTQWDYIEDRFGKGSKDLTPFTISDMDFESPSEIVDGMRERIDHRVYGYSRWNHSDYKGAISNWFMKRGETKVDEDWIVYAPSVLYSISLFLEILLKDSGKVMTHTPRYDGFTKLLKIYDLVEVELREVEGKYETDFNKIEEGFKDGVKVFLLCNPQNPTGKLWTEEELKKLVDIAKKYNGWIISDEIHMDVVRKKHTPILKLDSERSIIVSSPTKTFNTPAFGGSFGIIPNRELREKFIDHTKSIDAVSTPSILGVLSTIIAYNECEYWVEELKEYIYTNFKLVKDELDGYKGLKVYIPDSTYLMWIDISGSGLTQEELQDRLIKKGRVAIMSGELYGDKNKIRLNVGCSKEKLKKGVEGIKKALEDL